MSGFPDTAGSFLVVVIPKVHGQPALVISHLEAVSLSLPFETGSHVAALELPTLQRMTLNF